MSGTLPAEYGFRVSLSIHGIDARSRRKFLAVPHPAFAIDKPLEMRTVEISDDTCSRQDGIPFMEGITEVSDIS